MNKISEQMLDQILAEVDETIAEVDRLAKSEDANKPAPKLKKDEVPAPAEEPAPEAAPEDAAPEAAAPEAPAPEAAPEAAAPEAPADPAAEIPADPQQEAELSDEELHEIYGAMPPEELERHYMIVRQMLAAHYGEKAPEAAPEAPAEQPAAEGAAPEAAAPAPEAPAPEEEEMGKSEEKDLRTKLAKAEDEVKTLSDQVTKLVTAIEKSVVPSRKAITGIEYIRKSEADGGEETPETSSLSKAEKKEKCKDLVKSGKLTSSDRLAINNFFLRDEDEAKIDKLIGGSK